MFKELKRMIELEKVLEVECPKHDANCEKCPCLKECDEYSHLFFKLEGGKWK